MRNYFYTLCFFLLTVTGYAQVSSVSPYSSQGIGDVSFYGDAYFTAFGGASVALIDSSQVNLFNPSSYAYVAQGLPLFSLGLAHQEAEFNQDDVTARDRFTSITHMSLVVPFANRFGLAFGLKPYSRTGYEINNAEFVEGDSLFYDYTGKGEIQEFLIGFSIKLVNSFNHRLAIGANGKRFFGRLENERMAYRRVNQQMSGAYDQKFLQAGSYGYEFGGSYRYTPSTRHVLTLGGYYRNQQDMNISSAQTRVHFGQFSNINTYDTIIPFSTVNGTLAMPERWTAGFSYEFKPARDSIRRSGRLSSILFTAEYSSESWSDFRENSGGVEVNPGFLDAFTVRSGLQFLPHRSIMDRSTYIKSFQKWSYRIGAYYSELPYEIGGSQIEDMGISVGVGIPFVLSRAVSSVNFSVNYGQRGAMDNPAILRENYIGFNFGLNIAPSYDRWFTKYELD